MAPARQSLQQQLDEAATILRQKNQDILNYRKALDNLRKENDTAEKIREEIFKIAQRSPEPPAWLSGHGVRNGTRGGPITIWSDFHYGEKVDSDQVAGVNEYNAFVAQARFHRLVDTTLDLCFNHMGRAGVAYPGIVVCLGGDMIGGDIHEELAWTNDRTSQQGVNELTDLLAAGLDRLASKFGRVFLPCVVGNHGRSTRRPHNKNRVYTNHDWSIYCNLEREFRKNKAIQFLVPPEHDAFFTVFGHRYCLTHGDTLGTKGGDGIIGALGPIMRGALKVHRSEAQIGRDYDTLIMGHWHQYITLPGLIVNNALKGYDEFARAILRAPYARPSQALWFSHPEHGITAHWQVYVEKLQATPDAKEWLRVPDIFNR